MLFSIEQYVFIVKRNYETKSHNSVRATFVNEYPEVGTPTNSAILQLITKFHETRSCVDKWKEYEPTVCTPENKARRRAELCWDVKGGYFQQYKFPVPSFFQIYVFLFFQILSSIINGQPCILSLVYMLLHLVQLFNHSFSFFGKN